jgi:hypothetical protein
MPPKRKACLVQPLQLIANKRVVLDVDGNIESVRVIRTGLLDLPADVLRKLFAQAEAMLPGLFVCHRLHQALQPVIVKPSKCTCRTGIDPHNSQFCKVWYTIQHTLHCSVPRDASALEWIRPMLSWYYNTGACPTTAFAAHGLCFKLHWIQLATSACHAELLDHLLKKYKWAKDGFCVAPRFFFNAISHGKLEFLRKFCHHLRMSRGFLNDINSLNRVHGNISTVNGWLMDREHHCVEYIA